MTKTFWLSYDLGIKGDYSSLYKWLDERHAKECGDSFAVFKYQHSTDKPQEEIKKSLVESISFSKTDRIYLIWRDDATNLNQGTFIVGHRKAAPWEGYFVTESGEAWDS